MVNTDRLQSLAACANTSYRRSQTGLNRQPGRTPFWQPDLQPARIESIGALLFVRCFDFQAPYFLFRAGTSPT